MTGTAEFSCPECGQKIQVAVGASGPDYDNICPKCGAEIDQEIIEDALYEADDQREKLIDPFWRGAMINGD